MSTKKTSEKIAVPKKDSKPPAAAKEEEVKLIDPIAFSHNFMKAYERALPVFNEFVEYQKEHMGPDSMDPMNMRDAYMKMLERWREDPSAVIQTQTEYFQKWMQLWGESARRMMGEESHSIIEPEKGDRRFRADEWNNNAMFDFIKQSYLLTAEAMQKTVSSTEGLDQATADKLNFFTKQFADALSPTNFALTNPEVLKETMKTGGENLLKGFENLVDDIHRGKGDLKISITDYDAFKVGENVATTEGSVVFQNDLIQLIQYTPQTDKVYKRPMMIVPPWINKYYILDLRPSNSFIKYAVDQGHTVFIMSWVNPDAKMAQKQFEDYMQEGVLTSLEQIEKITGEKSVNAVGYCLGGTLLASTLAYLKETKQDDKIASATFLTTLLDFENAGELKLFIDEEQLANMEREMKETGLFNAKKLQQTFSWLRSNELIWSFVVNNYLMGKEPFPFDLLYWNDDSTNMPAAMHIFYLRNMYLNNRLVKPGGISMKDVPIDLKKVETPAYFVSTREDHIAPWRATYAGTQLFSGKVSFTLAASGHIAGIVNPPAKEKYCYWTNEDLPKNPQKWRDNTKEHKGSWWPHWQKWLKDYTGPKVDARKIKKSLEKAPGSYVKAKFDEK